jgi:general secretion pathway protein A
MYNSLFGLDVDPFRVNPDPRFLYFSESHREALATLIYAMRERKGFVVLTGEVGTGKTTVVNALLQNLETSVQTAYLFNTALSLEDFFVAIFDELGLERVEPFRKSVALSTLNQYLIDRLRKGQQTVLLIDEAQNLSAELLEEIRMLSNLETPQSKLLQIMLIGQPELVSKLKRPELRQLRQRVELFHAIQPLSGKETAGYVHERLIIAGHETGDVFNAAALRAVYKHTRGIPRVVNVLCDNAMLTAFSKRTVRISAHMVTEAARELGLTGSAGLSPLEPSGANGRKQGWFRRMFAWRRPAAEAGL